ncbi:protein of unknown function [Magnetospirillum sp. XM-1]|uniref:hypothetical protein n=1 Tax=Magnetospirillum sp. XM-1 TaxID=1663591 RepID=UPI00073DCF67|nr:hypothetical protein [Magnetospirillum sp. XM-1]CUW39695.1 protein of unknown function [Magnetospirillum sp. XM-1]
MTKPRSPESFEDAAMEVAVGLGVPECARLMDRSEGAVRAWTDPDKEGRPTLHQAVQMDAEFARRFKGRAPFLAAYLHALKRLCGEGPTEFGDVLDETLDVPEAVGRLVATIRRVTAAHSEGGRSITANEYRDVRAAMRDLRREIDELEAAIDADAMGSGR